MDTGPVHRAVRLFTPQLSLVLIASAHRGMARLSWPEWLVTYRDGLPARTHPRTNWARRRANTLMEHIVSTTRLRRYPQVVTSSLTCHELAIVKAICLYTRPRDKVRKEQTLILVRIQQQKYWLHYNYNHVVFSFMGDTNGNVLAVGLCAGNSRLDSYGDPGHNLDLPRVPKSDTLLNYVNIMSYQLTLLQHLNICC